MGVLKKKTEYYHLGRRCKVVGKAETGEKTTWVVVRFGDDSYDYDYEVVRALDLHLWEDTWEYKEQQKRKEEIALLNKNKETIIEELQNAAIKSLTNRIRLNAFFSEKTNGKDSAIVMVLVDELNKLIKEQKPNGNSNKNSKVL